MQELLREPTPVEVDPDTFTIKTAGRAMWGDSTLSIEEAVLKEQAERMKLSLKTEMARLKSGGLK
jgi:hypothetical protein